MSAAELAPDRRTIGRDEVLDWFTERGVYVGLLLLIAFNLMFTPRFAEVDNIRLQFVQVVPVAIIALGMALVIGTRGIDLSVGSVMAIASALLALYLGYGPVVAITIALLGGMAVGIANGVLISTFGIQPIVATLALLVGGRGLALVIAQGRLTEIFDPTLGAIGSSRLFGIPFVVLIALGVALIVAVLVARTTFGRYVVAIGGNPDASVVAGVPVRRTLYRGLRPERAARGPRGHHPDRAAQCIRSLVRREPDRTERDHGGRGRRDAAIGRPGPDRRDLGGRHADAAHRRDADHAQPARLGDSDGPGRDHPGGRLPPAPAERGMTTTAGGSARRPGP